MRSSSTLIDSKQKFLSDPGVRMLAENASLDEVLGFISDRVKDQSMGAFIIEVAKATKSFDAAALNLFKSVKFLPDVGGKQLLQRPFRLWINREGNCVDYTIFLLSLAKALGKQAKVVAADYGEGFEHVYPVVDGKVYDVCYWQAGGKGNKTLPPIWKKEISI